MTDRRPSPGLPPRAALALVRLLIVGGVLALGAGAWLLHDLDLVEPRPERAEPLRWAVTGVWVAAGAGVLWLRARHARSSLPAERRRLAVVAWALGETPALVGAVHYGLSGRPTHWGAGLVFLAVVLLLFPVRDER